MSTPRAEDHEFRPLSGVGGSADHPAVRQPPLRLALIVAFAVFIAEAIVMVVLSFLGPLATRDAALIDAALLVVLLSPTIYFFLLRPVSLHIAGRQEAEERIEHLNAVLRAVRSVNQLIVREKDRARLVRGACESLIESRGCHTAWIALLTGDGQVLETAGAGLDGAFASMAERWRRGTQPTCVERALSNSDPVVIHDPSSVCGDCALAGKYAGRIGVSVRLEHEGKVYGVLAVSVPEEFAGDAEERSLLREVAQDVGFALRTIEREEERSQAQRAVRVSEERYRTIFETSGTAMAIIDSDTTIALANSEFEKLSGYTREELEDRKSWTEFVTEDDLDRMIEYHRLRRVDREAAPRRYDFRFLDRKGRLRDILLSIDMIPGTDRSVASLLDLTERKRAEEEIRRHLKRIRALLEIDRAITSSLDLDQVLDLVLERLQEVVAYDSAGVFLVADSRAKLTAGKGYPDREGALQVSFPVEQDPLAAQILSEKRPQVVADAQSDERFRGRGGAEYVRSWIGVPLVAKGRALGFLTIDHTEPGVYDEESAEMAQAFANHAAIAIDNAQSYQEAQRELLERQRTQLKLRESEARYRALFNNASEAIFIHDLEGKFLEVNDVACQRLGYSHEELLQMGLQDLAAREWDETDLPTKRLPEEEPVYWEMVHAGRDGRQIPVELSSRVIDYDGKESVLSIARDVSERREMEKQLRRQERLAAVGQLAGGIAHDFNNLLTTVVLYAAIALRRRDLPAGLEGSLETILEESQRASQLVDQILDFSRRSPMEKEPVDLLLNLEQATDVLRRTIPKSIRVTLEAEPGPYVVEADPTRVQQVVMNLALNARDAMPNGGRLDIRLGRTAVRADGRPPVRGMPVGDWVRLSFTDTGMGMSEQVRAHLFEPFFTTKAPGEGTGLGLAQVHGIVMQHGGYIDVESEPGAGSTFTVYLPSHQEKAVRDAEADAAAYPEGSGERILLVEDEPPVRAAIEDSLEALNYQVLCAEHGEDALEIYRSTQDIDLVVTDLVMPVMGGAELAEALREENRDLKIIALTGHDAKQELDELERTTARAVIQKPFGIDELAIVVQRVLDEG